MKETTHNYILNANTGVTMILDSKVCQEHLKFCNTNTKLN